jgi:predicted PurR-regulated permease PerM
MFKKKEPEKTINYTDLNESIHLLKGILKIAYVLCIIIGIYAITIIFKEWHLKETIIMVLKTISPLFIGFFLAWLFDPIVTFLERRGIRRVLGAIITYVSFVLILLVIVGSIFPILSDQMNDFIKMIPTVFDNIKTWIENILMKFDNIENFDVVAFKENIFNNIEYFGTNLTAKLPMMIVNIVKDFISGTGVFLVGLIIGFYLSISFKNASESIITLFPKKMRDDARDLANEVNMTCRHFVRGALIDSSIIFIVSSIAFALCGLKAPLLFGLFCGITNVIPYAGPYIGGIPAVIVAFSQGTTTGILVLISIVVIQTIEGNFLQALIMSKSTKLHPVTIIIGLLVFGYFFGIVGMVISTPIIGACKAVFMFFNEKYELVGYKK